MTSERESTGGGSVLVDPLGGLALEPSNELKFKGPFDDYVTVSLVIRNPTEKRIAFKIKTTAPKRYCVKPNSGVLDPAQSMKVNVLLQPFNYDPNEKNKHKFMVQYMYLNDVEMLMSVNDILNMWKDVSPTRLLDLKLKCVFENTEAEQQKIAQQQQQQQSTSTDQHMDKTAASVTSAAASPQEPQTAKPRESKLNRSSNKSASENSEFHPADFDSARASILTQPTPNTNNNNSSAGAAVVTSRPDKNENTLNELKLARQENESLRKEINRLKEDEARLKKMALQAPSSSAGGQHGSVEVLADLLNNRSTIIIISLLAIVIYLLLFR